MPLLALGINHNTAPVHIRERIAFPPEHLQHALQDLRTSDGIKEAAILSTCNRTELYCGLASTDSHSILEWLENYHTLNARELRPYVYQHPDQAAVRHVMRVAAGLDSMVIGEPQILGQVKSAYQSAHDAGTLGTLLNRLFQHTFSVAKQVRTDTRIGASAVSVAFATVSLAKQIFGDLKRQTALLIGAGDTIELVARHFHENAIGRLIVANRTLARAHGLVVSFKGYAIGLNEVPAHLAEADIVIAATGSPSIILEQSQVRSSLKQRKHRPIFMVDIAVPRNIDPRISQMEDIYLYTVDDLRDIIQENLQSRRDAAKQAEEIIDIQAEHFMAWLRAHNTGHAIRKLRSRAETVRDQAVEQAQRQLSNGKDPAEVLLHLAHGLTNKLMHHPSAGLRQAGAQNRDDLVKAIKILYKLEDGDC